MLNQQSEKQSSSSTIQNWIAFGKLVATDNFAASLFCTAKSIFREWQLVAVPKLWFLHCRLCCRDLGSLSSNDKHSLEEQFWYLAFTTSTVAPSRVARLGWFRSQAKLPLYCFWLRSGQVCHGPWDVKSTIRKAVLPKHNTKLDCIRKTGGYRQLRSFAFLHCKIYIQRMAAGSSPKVVVLALPPLL